MKNSDIRKSNVKGFTLAETLITLTILGVVAAITIPALINKYNESTNRTKLKKAMAAYEKALNQMIIDNDIKGSISAVEGFGSDCSESTKYFKKVVEITPCRFQTADKVWWDITDIEHPVISLKDEITDDNIETLKGNADSLDDDKTSFVMVGEIKDGIVRINDKGAVSAEGKDYVDKLFAFLNKDKTGGSETLNQSEFMSKKCTKNVDDTYTCEGNDAKYFEATFTEECITLQDGQESCPVSTTPTVVAMVRSDTTWGTAQYDCLEGTHLAKAAELQQLWNNGAAGNTLESLCDNCSRNDKAKFWVAEATTFDDYYAYLFSTNKGQLAWDYKGYHSDAYMAICVGD